jgi:hypothetical protein
LNNRKQEQVSDVDLAEEEYLQLEKMERKFKDWLMADVWTSAFFIEKTEVDQTLYPTNVTLENLRENQPVNEALINRVLKTADHYNFFHYHLEFPEVFEKGGFDCLLGNPPWEKIKVQELEFFSLYDSSIANATTKDKREQLINKLKEEGSIIYSLFLDLKRNSEVEANFYKYSGRYLYGNAGDVNLYALFAETYYSLLNKNAKSGFIVPPGIATDDTYKKFIKYLIDENIIEEFFNFTNRGYLFAEVESTMAFALYTFTRNKKGNLIRIAAKIWQVEHLKNPNRVYFLTPYDVQLLNPNTENLPIFENSIDSELVRNIYRRNEILSNEKYPSINSWDIKFGSMLHMTNESHLFKTLPELIDAGYNLNENIFEKGKNTFVPVYESKLIYQYNHRAATFEGIPEERKYLRRAATNPATTNDLENPHWVIQPRYWIELAEVKNRLPLTWKYNWLIGYRNAINAVADSRSTILTVIPRYGVGNSLPLIFSELSAKDMMLLIGNINSFVLDYITRQKASGGNLNFYVVKQLAVVGYKTYSESIKSKIVSNVSNLLVNSDDLIDLSYDLGLNGKINNWSSKKRFQLQCELDAIYAHLYGLEKEEMEYILETFPVVKRKDIAKYGSYRTKETILKLYDEFVWVRDEMKLHQTTKTEKA